MITAEECELLLTGKAVRLYPYIRGHWPSETLYTLWHYLIAEHAEEKIFTSRPRNGTPFPQVGDLVDFIKFFEPEPPQQRFLLMAQSLERDDIAGMFWFDDYVPGQRAAGSVFYRRRYWGDVAREASRLALGWGFAVLNVRSIWAYSAWSTGRGHAEAAGMRQVARLPEYLCVGERAYDLSVFRITREEFEQHG